MSLLAPVSAMNLADTYILASKARSKLTMEARRSDHNLRLLVSHANMLDNIMDHLADVRKPRPQLATVAQQPTQPMLSYGESESESDSDSDSDDWDYDSDSEEEDSRLESVVSLHKSKPFIQMATLTEEDYESYEVEPEQTSVAVAEVGEFDEDDEEAPSLCYSSDEEDEEHLEDTRSSAVLVELSGKAQQQTLVVNELSV